MTGLALSLALYLVVGGAVACPFFVVGRLRMKEGRTSLARVLLGWGVIVVVVPPVAALLAYAFLPREPGWDGHEPYPLWPFVMGLAAFSILGGTFTWFLGWLLGRGATSDTSPPPNDGCTPAH